MVENAPPWSVPVAVDEIEEAGQRFELVPDQGVRDAIARIAGLHALPKLAATFDLTPHGSGVHVVGNVSAVVGQQCVVTLDPIENEIEESVDVVFMPDIAAGSGAPKSATRGQEPPEPLVGGKIDLGQLAIEFLILATDPYPRKADAQFAPPPTEGADAKPFAALEALKKRFGNDRN